MNAEKKTIRKPGTQERALFLLSWFPYCIFWNSLVLALAVMLLSGCSLTTNAPGGKPFNVLFIVADDLNTREGCYGFTQVRTPNLDRLAAGGMRFDRCYCQYPVCNPSRSSFLTGLRPETSRVFDNNVPLRQALPDAITLPQCFKSQGYWTAVVNKLFHDKENDGDHSWDERRTLGDSRNAAIEHARKRFEAEHGRIDKDNRALWEEVQKSLRAQAGGQTPPGYGPTDMSDGEHGDGKSARQVIEWLEKRPNGDKPFFIGWGLQRPHIPHWAPQKYFDLYPLGAFRFPEQPADDLTDVPQAAINPRYKLYGEPVVPDATRREVTAAYYACVSFIDAQVGLVLDALERLELAKTTIVVFIGDHGYLLGEHGLWEKAMLFEPVARVPLLVRVPRITRPAGVCPRLVEFVDLYPTLAALCRLKPPENLEGLSFVPLLREPKRSWKRGAFTMLRRGSVVGRSVRTEKWRYTEWSENHGAELYDEEHDPDEYRNLAGDVSHAANVKELRALLHAGWREALPPE